MKKVVLILAIALLGTISLNAQKVGHINVAELVSTMPSYLKAQETLKTFAETKGAVIKQRQDALEVKGEAFKVKAGAADAKSKQAALEAEYKTLQDEAVAIQELQNKAQKELQEKEEGLIQPINDAAMAAIEKVSASKGLEYVFDSSLGVLIVAKGEDILNAVKKELGM